MSSLFKARSQGQYVTKFCVGREELINVYKFTKFDLQMNVSWMVYEELS